MHSFGRLIVSTLVCGATAAGCRNAPKKTGQHPASFEKEIRKTVSVNYLIYLPEDYGKTDQDWPLMLFLHGAGERGDDLDQLLKHGPPKLVSEGRQFPFVIVSPQCPEYRWWDVDTLGALLDEIEDGYDIDEDRIYVTGLSMGGFGTWALAMKQPERFAAIAPICGGGIPEAVDSIKHLPAWVFHGAKDRVVPIRRSREMVEALEAAGGEVKFTVYPDVGHDSWTAAYDDEALYEWLLGHSRE